MSPLVLVNILVTIGILFSSDRRVKSQTTLSSLNHTHIESLPRKETRSTLLNTPFYLIRFKLFSDLVP